MSGREQIPGYRLSRRTLLAAVPGLILLAACGGDDDDDSDDAATSTPAAAAATNTPAQAVATATTAAAATSETSGEWSFTDDRGTTVTLPKPPERIVAQVSVAATLWDYGVRPIAVFGPQRRPDGTQDPQAGNIDLDAVESAGEVWDEVDIEKVASVQPDLIISSLWGEAFGGGTEELEPTLRNIAPTLAIRVQDVSISEPIARFEELAEALGADLSSPENVESKTHFEQVVDDLKAAIAEKPDLAVMYVAAWPDALYVANPKVPTDLIYYLDLGLNIVTPDAAEGEWWETLSWEQANKYAQDADLIMNDARQGALTAEQLADIATWGTLPAVQAGQVGPWYTEVLYSYKSYAAILEEMTEIIRGAKADIV